MSFYSSSVFLFLLLSGVFYGYSYSLRILSPYHPHSSGKTLTLAALNAEISASAPRISSLKSTDLVSNVISTGYGNIYLKANVNDLVSQVMQNMNIQQKKITLIFDDEDKLSGVFTETDYVKKVISLRKNPGEIFVRDVMVPRADVLVAAVDWKLGRCENVMTRARIQYLPVMENVRDLGSKVLAVIDRKAVTPKRHVMVSYCWNLEAKPELVAKLVGSLRAKNYEVWRDVDGSSIVGPMSGSTQETMAEAIENADTMIICVSREYKDSNNCRLEANYGSQLQHKGKLNIIYVMMQQDYTTSSEETVDGYLGLMIGNALWYPLWSEDKLAGTASSIESILGDNCKTMVKVNEPQVQSTNSVLDSDISNKIIDRLGEVQRALSVLNDRIATIESSLKRSPPAS